MTTGTNYAFAMLCIGLVHYMRHTCKCGARVGKENSLHGLVHLLNKTVASQNGSDAAVSRSLVLLGPIPLLSLLCV